MIEDIEHLILQIQGCYNFTSEQRLTFVKALIYNLNNNYMCNTKGETISHLMTWSGTPQGFAFWDALNTSLAGSSLPYVEPQSNPN